MTDFENCGCQAKKCDFFINLRKSGCQGYKIYLLLEFWELGRYFSVLDTSIKYKAIIVARFLI